MQPRMTTRPAISLHRPTPADEERFLRAAEASAELHSPWYWSPRTPREYRDYLARCATDAHDAFLIVDDESGELAGTVTVGNIVRRNFLSAHLGYAAFSPHEGKGLMESGMAAVIDEAFGNLGLHRLEANVQPANERSTALVRKLGFRLEGHSPRYLIVDGDWRDHDRWAILKEEWRLI